MKHKILTVQDVDDLTVALSKNLDIPYFDISDCTLPALLEFACQRWIWSMQKGFDILAYFPKLKMSPKWGLLERMNTAITCLQNNEPGLRSENRSSNKLEIYPLPQGNECSDVSWDLFQQKFEKIMRDNGFPEKLAKAITGALAEMADNVEQHSESKIRGLVGYEVNYPNITYSVVDVGIGVFNSLRQNPQFVNLGSASEAIYKALQPGISKVSNVPRGLGFQTVFRSLAAFTTKRLLL